MDFEHKVSPIAGAMPTQGKAMPELEAIMQSNREFGAIGLAAVAATLLFAAIALSGCGGGGSSSSGSVLGSSSGSGGAVGQSQAVIGGTAAGLSAGNSLSLLNNGGDALSVNANGAFQFASGIAVGGVYDVTIGRQPAKQTCTVTGGAGSVASSAPVTSVQVSCVTHPIFVYVANSGSNSVSIYTLDETTGDLTSLPGGPYGAGSSSAHLTSVAVNPACTAIYVLDTANKALYYASIAASGAIPAKLTSHVSTGPGPASVSLNPAGTVAYVTNTGDSTISAYSLSAVNGAPTSLTGSPFQAGSGPRMVAFNPAATVAYVPNSTGNSIFAYQADPNTGVIKAVVNPTYGTPKYPAGSAPLSVAFTPSGAFAYVADSGGNKITAFSVNSSTAVPTALSPTSTFATGTSPDQIVLNHAGTFAVVLNEGSNTVSVYSVNGTSGVLTEVAGSPFQAGTNPVAASFDPTDKYLYVLNYGMNLIWLYSVASNGALATLGSIFTGAGPLSLVVAQP